MQLTDYSDLRSNAPIEIPLNGVTYYAVADPPADVLLGVSSIGGDGDTADLVRAMRGDETLTPERMAAAAQQGRSAGEKMIDFLMTVLEEESAELWRRNMAAPPKNATKKQRADHAKARITIKQMTAVIRDLIRAYSAGDPTSGSSSSSTSANGTGATSTAGARAAG